MYRINYKNENKKDEKNEFLKTNKTDSNNKVNVRDEHDYALAQFS